MAVFEVKHLVADFFLQNEYMLGKFKRTGWELPLAAHCAVHAVFTGVIALLVKPEVNWVLWAMFMDFICHFSMDRIKASPDLLGRFTALTKETYHSASEAQKHSNKWFWYTLGIDQFVHNLTHLFIVWVLTK